jgi:hypothetical protein
MPTITSKEDLRDYLNAAPAIERLTPPEIDLIVNAAVFDNGTFRGMFLGALSTKFNEDQRAALRTALGDLQIHTDCYPGATKCGPLDNCWCAH